MVKPVWHKQVFAVSATLNCDVNFFKHFRTKTNVKQYFCLCDNLFTVVVQQSMLNFASVGTSFAC